MLRVLVTSLLLVISSVAAGAEAIRIGSTGCVTPFLSKLAAEFNATHPDVHATVLPSLGSSGAIRAVANGAVEIAVAARPLNARESSPLLAMSKWAATPLVFAVQQHSRVRSVTTRQLIEIYGGSRTRWDDGQRIRPVLRPQSDSEPMLVAQTMPGLAPVLAAANDRPGAVVAVTDNDAADALKEIPDSFGMSTMVLIVGEKLPLVPLALDGAEPSLAAISDGRYPLVKPLFTITAANPRPATRAFLAFLKSDAIRRMAADIQLQVE